MRARCQPGGLRLPGWLRGLEPLDWLAAGLLLAGLVAAATGALPRKDTVTTLGRVLPLVLFLGSVFVLAKLTAFAEVFDAIAARLAIWAGGSFLALFALCVVFASATTTFLNLDTTAVLLTPVIVATAKAIDMPPLPLAMLTVWLANTASLLLPISNLTNLLAANRVGLTPVEMAARMALPQLASILVTAACLWLFYWRRGRRGSDRYTRPPSHTPKDPVLFWLSAAACSAFVLLVLAGVSLPLSSVACASLLVVPFAFRDRKAFDIRMVPLRLLAFVVGLFLIVQTIDRYGLGRLLRGLVGTDDGVGGIVRAGTLGATLSNLVNNLPSYVAVETAVPVHNGHQLLGLLIGTNVGPLVTPWASLAIIIWYESCRNQVTVRWRRFAATGAVTAVATLGASLVALSATAG